MKELQERILRDGLAIGTEVLKVDSFLNHQIDVSFMSEVGKEFKRRFADCKVDKILTIEASGIGIACLTAQHFDCVPVVFAKKNAPNTMDEDTYSAESRSFTKGTVSVLRVAKKFLHENENVLIIDDFLAHGQAATALCSILEQAGANIVGVGAVIEKEFQGGSALLREMGIRVESLAVIKKINDGKITFA